MADFNTKVRFADSGISTSTSTASPTLKRRGTELYIVAPTGFLRTTDKIRLARNISSRWKSRRYGSSVANTGWLRPMMNGKAMIPLKLEYIQYMSNAYVEYWRVSVNLQLTDNTGAEIPQTEVARMLYYYETQYLERQEAVVDGAKYIKVTHSGSVQLYLSGKQLGICVERNGVQITDYMTFAVDLICGKSNSTPTVGYATLAKYNPRWIQSVSRLRGFAHDWVETIGL